MPLVGLAFVLGAASANAQSGLSIAVDEPEQGNTVNEGDLGDNGRPPRIVFFVERSDTSRDETFDFTLGGTATAGADYRKPINTDLSDVAIVDGEVKGKVTLPAGWPVRAISVQLLDDDLVEPDETVTLTVGAATATVTVEDDDEGPVRISISTSDGYENHPDNGNVPATFTVALDPPAGVPVTVDYETTELGLLQNAAQSGEDYRPASGTLTFAPGETEKTVEVAILDDSIVEDKQFFYLFIRNESASSPEVDVEIDGVSVTGWVFWIFSEDRYTLSVDSPSVSEGQPTESADLPLVARLSNPLQGWRVMVGYTLGGTADAGADYTGPASGTLVFTPGQTEKTIPATVSGDDDVEDDETVTVTATVRDPIDRHVTSGGDEATGTGTIRNDDHRLTIGAPTVTEGDSGTTELEFAVTLAPPSHQTIEIGYGVTGGTADAGTDFAAVPADSKVAFAPGETERTVSVTVNGDTEAEKDETVEVTFTNLTATAAIPSATGTGTIRNDEPTVSRNGTGPVREGFDGLVRVRRVDTSSRETLQLVFGGSATAGDDYVATLDRRRPGHVDSVTFDAGEDERQLTLIMKDDDVDEEDETVVVSIGTSSVTLTIADQDDPPEVSVEAPEAAVTEGDGDLVFPVALSRRSSREIAVSYALGGTATEGEDYATDPGGGTVTFAPGETRKTITLATVDDPLNEPDSETVEVALTEAPSGLAVLDADSDSATATVTDDEPTSRVHLVNILGEPDGRFPVDATVTEGDGFSLRYSVRLEPGNSRPVTVMYVLGGTATAGADYTDPGGGAVTFAPGETRKPIALAVTDDDLVEWEERVSVTLSLSSSERAKDVRPSSDVNRPTVIRRTIRDNDLTFSVEAPGSAVAENAGAEVVFTVTLSAGILRTVTVPYRLSGTATAGADYTDPGGGAVTFAPGETRKTVALAVTDDNIDEPDEAVELAIGGVSASATIADRDDPPVVSVEAPESAVIEGNGSLVFPVRLSHPSSRRITVPYTLGGTADAVTDYTAPPQGRWFSSRATRTGPSRC